MSSPVWHPFTQHGLNEAIPQIVSAQGEWLTCADGTQLLDAISSWWVITHGHCEPRIAAAIAAQAHALDQLIFAGYTHPQAEALARGLIDIAPPGLAHVFFSDSGSTAVEVALKMALGHWHNRRAPRHRILVLEHSYHGDTIGAMSVGARSIFNRAYEPLLFDVATVPFPADDGGQGTLDALEALCTAPDTPAAFIVEPLILGAGGMLVYAPDILREMREICARHDVLFIADEVMTGWGPQRHALRLRAGRGRPGHPVPCQGPHRRRRPARGDARRRGRLRLAPQRKPRRHVLPFVELHGESGLLRGRQCQSGDLARGGCPRAHRDARRCARCRSRRAFRPSPVRAGSAASPRSISSCPISGYLSDVAPALRLVFWMRAC